VFFQDLIDGFNFQLQVCDISRSLCCDERVYVILTQVSGITIDLSKHIQQQPVHFMVGFSFRSPHHRYEAQPSQPPHSSSSRPLV
jgi:hypothetical protein